jgi:hypothetical protein
MSKRAAKVHLAGWSGGRWRHDTGWAASKPRDLGNDRGYRVAVSECDLINGRLGVESAGIMRGDAIG